MKETVSIVVPVYKVEQYLDKCVETLVDQTYGALEIILVDDGSPDRCPELCDRWAQRDPRVRVIHRENGGVGEARNTGMDASSGECLMFVDPDDYLPDNAVELLMARLLADGSDLAMGRVTKIFDDGRCDGRHWEFFRDRCLTGEELLCGLDGGEQPLVSVLGKLYTRSVLEGIRFPPMRSAEDLWVFPLISRQCEVVSMVDQLVYYYYQRSDSIVHTKTDVQNLESVRASLHMVDIYLQMEQPECAARWFGISVQYIQELEKRHLGVELAESIFSEREIRRMLKNGNRVSRVKWFLLRHPRLYDGVFGVKRAVTKLLVRE